MFVGRVLSIAFTQGAGMPWEGSQILVVYEWDHPLNLSQKYHDSLVYGPN